MNSSSSQQSNKPKRKKRYPKSFIKRQKLRQESIAKFEGNGGGVADHYNDLERTYETRNESEIIGLRKFNNWVKSVLIQSYVTYGAHVLDLCCGKGGDLKKYSIAEISRYVGADVAKKSLVDAVDRYSSMNSVQFESKFIWTDCSKYDIVRALDDNEWFDVVSCQFSLHYTFESEAAAQMLFRNASVRLVPGGAFIVTTLDAEVLVKKLREQGNENNEFGNDIYRVKFDKKRFPKSEGAFGHRYQFFLEDAISNIPEYLVPSSTIRDIAQQHDMKVEMELNFHRLYELYGKHPNFQNLLYRIGVFGKDRSINQAEWEAAYLYKAYVFVKHGTYISRHYNKPIKSKLTSNDIIDLM
eukprot:gb/GECH01002022.1/.p1 GENE.gb/GECH01002022.1/~~gb/GECH01002022.1/.p1  ORF type:complete len:355 (+),score=92.51 gb/GECH01002022.1/:1-1065(+)